MKMFLFIPHNTIFIPRCHKALGKRRQLLQIYSTHNMMIHKMLRILLYVSVKQKFPTKSFVYKLLVEIQSQNK